MVRIVAVKSRHASISVCGAFLLFTASQHMLEEPFATAWYPQAMQPPLTTLPTPSAPRFQRWAPQAPPELTFTYNLMRSGSFIKLYHLGPLGELQALVAASGLAGLPGASFVLCACDALTSRGWLATNNQPDPFCSSGNIAVPQRADPGGALMQDREGSK